jgi:HlyD family secretion protein
VPRRARFGGRNSKAAVLLLLVGSVCVLSPTARTVLLSPISSFLRPAASNFDHLVTEVVQRGTFQVTVTEKGTIDSLRNATLTSKVEGATTIISIVPEGTQVKEGDLVCELDASALVDKATQQEISVTQAEAALQQAEKEVEIQDAVNKSSIEAAILAYDLAEIDLKKFREGDYVQQQMELDTMVRINKENLSRAKDYLNYLERLVRKGYRMQSDLDAERIAYSRADNDRKVAETKLRVLEEYTKERTERELIAKVEETKRQIERSKSQADAAMAQKLADLKAKKLTHEVQSNLLKRLQNQIAACKIYAPQDGQVVYANTRDGRSSDQVLIEVGATVRERQPIINLPDLDAMKVNARIHESRISLVRTGLTATVKVDAAPTETFHGEVDSVSSVPSSLNSFNRDLKEYEAVVRLTDDVAKVNQLRPGLSATVEILVDQREDVLQAPVQSLISIVDKRFAYVLGPRGPELREITIGDTNERTVEILGGLEEGERVVMNPRTHFSREIGELEQKLAREKAAAPEQAPPKSPTPPAESRPERPAGPEGAPQRPRRESTGEPGEGPRRFDPLAGFQRMDQNQDGKLTVDELNERMRPQFENMDTDHNGSIDQQEFTTFASQFRQRGGGGSPPSSGD